MNYGKKKLAQVGRYVTEALQNSSENSEEAAKICSQTKQKLSAFADKNFTSGSPEHEELSELTDKMMEVMEKTVDVWVTSVMYSGRIRQIAQEIQEHSRAYR